jgi:hypothetical protein
MHSLALLTMTNLFSITLANLSHRRRSTPVEAPAAHFERAF